MAKKRKKDWDQKVEIAKNSYLRSKNNTNFAAQFYENLFFLNPKVESLFEGTDFKHQRKLLLNGIDFLFEYSQKDENAKKQISRLARVHNIEGLNIHPHLYYYWVEALVLTIKKMDPAYEDDLEFYIREIVSYPISFFVSQYFIKS